MGAVTSELFSTNSREVYREKTSSRIKSVADSCGKRRHNEELIRICGLGFLAEQGITANCEMGLPHRIPLVALPSMLGGPDDSRSWLRPKCRFHRQLQVTAIIESLPPSPPRRLSSPWTVLRASAPAIKILRVSSPENPCRPLPPVVR